MAIAGPWISGPKEILEHAASLLAMETEASYRIAFLTIDNAIELLLKTYLSLPERITGANFSKSKYDENFPSLLKILEESLKGQLEGIKLDEVEWYHRLRNQLYHQGNGLSIERDKVESYLQIGVTLLRQLFNYELNISTDYDYKILVQFISAWHKFENSIIELRLKDQIFYDKEIDDEINSYFRNSREAIDTYREEIGFNSSIEYYEETYHLERLYSLWEKIQLGEIDFRKSITVEDLRWIENLQEMADEFRRSLG